MAGKVRVDGDMAKLLALQGTAPLGETEELAARIREITRSGHPELLHLGRPARPRSSGPSCSIVSVIVQGWNRRTVPPWTKKTLPVAGQSSVAR